VVSSLSRKCSLFLLRCGVIQYNLHAVCFNSGWTGMNAIRSYIKGTGDQWWRFQEKTIEKVRQGLHYTFWTQSKR
jgi:hypothetical protein